MSAPRFKSIYIIAGLAVCLGLAAMIAIHFARGQPADPVDARPDTSLPIFMLPDNYVFRQDDARWGGETIGETEDSLTAYGCTIASVAMAASNLTQSEITPMELETRLTQAGGFTDRGWLIWDKVSEATDGKVAARYYDAPQPPGYQSLHGGRELSCRKNQTL